ncbi:MAG TPA: hypothetical protein VFQ51_09270, partial [Vicinamibacteria bacterium]|nr:hypothetical protein [Vicinamibacteria bacterium]
MIRVELPAHLRTLARVDREVSLELQGAATAPGPSGSRAPAGCACTRSSSTRATRSVSTSPS